MVGLVFQREVHCSFEPFFYFHMCSRLILDTCITQGPKNLIQTVSETPDIDLDKISLIKADVQDIVFRLIWVPDMLNSPDVSYFLKILCISLSGSLKSKNV